VNRNGKQLRPVKHNDPRRRADARNAWRKMSFEQRVEFLDWIQEGAPDADSAQDIARDWEEQTHHS
jgi:hypothetical protein